MSGNKHIQEGTLSVHFICCYKISLERSWVTCVSLARWSVQEGTTCFAWVKEYEMQMYVWEWLAWPSLGALSFCSTLTGAELLKMCYFLCLAVKSICCLQQWYIPKAKGYISRHDKASQKQLRGLWHYLRSQDGMCWQQGAHIDSQAAVKPPSFVLLCPKPDLWGAAILPLPVEEYISLRCVAAVGSSPAGGCCNYSTLQLANVSRFASTPLPLHHVKYDFCSLRKQ